MNENRSEFTRPHVAQMRKWLAGNQIGNPKQTIESRVAAAIDPNKLLDALN
jgi:hypothetical protein